MSWSSVSGLRRTPSRRDVGPRVGQSRWWTSAPSAARAHSAGATRRRFWSRRQPRSRGRGLLSGKGVRPDRLTLDWGELFKLPFTDAHPEQLKASLARAGIVTFQNSARFVGRNQVRVGDSVLNGKRPIVKAAGARPADLPM